MRSTGCENATMPTPKPSLFVLRAAQPGDVPRIVELICELAAFENLSHLLQVTPECQ